MSASPPSPLLWAQGSQLQDRLERWVGGTLTIVEAGGQVIQGPMEVPGGGWIVNGLDPEGAMFALTGAR
jgi:hypothetical protein